MKDGVAITGAGNLPCKHVIHLDAPSDLGQWQKLIHHALKKADLKGIESVAFPALGTGNNRNVGIGEIRTDKQNASKMHLNAAQSNVRLYKSIMRLYTVYCIVSIL